MTTYAKGADVEALARSARIIKAMQAELTRIEATSRGAMRSIEAGWGGVVTIRFRPSRRASGRP